jgi:hypothetical protein
MSFFPSALQDVDGRREAGHDVERAERNKDGPQRMVRFADLVAK